MLHSFWIPSFRTFPRFPPISPDPMSQTSLLDPQEVLHALNDLYVSKLLAGAAATLSIYDWVLVFADEYATIYQSRWTLPKILFVFIRVVTPPGLVFGAFQLSDLRPALSASFCRAWAVINTFGMLSSLVAANGLLALRLTALYGRKRKMVWFINTFFIASYAATFGLLIAALATYHSSIFYSDLLGVCASLGKSATMPAIFYAPSLFELFVFVMTAYRAYQDAKVLAGPSSAPFLIVLYRDGFLSFCVMFALRIWNIWIYLTQPLSSFNLGTPLMWAINTVLTTRVYMNLVYLSRKPVVTNSTQKEFVSPTTHTNGAGIAMKVHTFTEVRVQEDDYTAPTGRGPTNGDNRLSRGGAVTFEIPPSSQGQYAFDGGFNGYGAQKERSVAFTPYKASRIDPSMLHAREGDKKSPTDSEQSLSNPTKSPV